MTTTLTTAMFEINPNATKEERIAMIEVVVKDIHQRLFGNGQPGVLESLDKRIKTLEMWKWQIAGAAVALGVIADVVYRVLKP